MRGVPVVALHGVLLAGDDRARNVVARSRVAAHEAQAVGRHEMGLLGRNGGSLGIADQRAGIEGGLLAAAGSLDRLLDAQRPRVVEVEIGAIPGHQCRVGQAGAIVLGGEAGDIERGLDRFAQGLRREVGGAGVALALAGIDRDADALVAIELDGFHLVAAHRHRLPEAFRDIDFAGRRPLVAGVLEHVLGELLQGGESVGKCGSFGHGRGVGAGKSLS